ncbi:Mitochondrial fission 1 protein isoform 3 [Schistosoma japonicum]|uniref:Mitochondrial fission 1 protein isoform 3 n=1 Tax=Schistosoma japonicum TaxID=6182 RepID=A0A4Z2DL74_SCHJA|nr:Mitochondrial fission 1 protein [Schistosoma japonicum]TNN17294.1 Mitochondrial fission 1 protein isoform 3 [Schistosoma japonicum]
MSFMLKLLIAAYFQFGYFFIYTYEWISFKVTTLKLILLKPLRQLKQNDASLKSVKLSHSRNLLQYELCLDYAVNLLRTTNESNVMKAIEVILCTLKDNKLTKLQNDCLYHLAVSFIKLADYTNALIYCHCLLTFEPDNQKVKNLLLEIKSRTYKDLQNDSNLMNLLKRN